MLTGPPLSAHSAQLDLPARFFAGSIDFDLCTTASGSGWDFAGVAGVLGLKSSL